MSEIREIFLAAKAGDQSAELLLKTIALAGDKEAEAILYELVRNVQCTTNFSFAEAFARVCEANPMLHRAYLNSNG